MREIDYSSPRAEDAIVNLVNVACGMSKILRDMSISEGEGAQGHAKACAAESLGLLSTTLFDATRFFFEDADDGER